MFIGLTVIQTYIYIYKYLFKNYKM